jgi:hypothetical protein
VRSATWTRRVRWRFSRWTTFSGGGVQLDALVAARSLLVGDRHVRGRDLPDDVGLRQEGDGEDQSAIEPGRLNKGRRRTHLEVVDEPLQGGKAAGQRAHSLAKRPAARLTSLMCFSSTCLTRRGWVGAV